MIRRSVLLVAVLTSVGFAQPIPPPDESTERDSHEVYRALDFELMKVSEAGLDPEARLQRLIEIDRQATSLGESWEQWAIRNKCVLSFASLMAVTPEVREHLERIRDDAAATMSRDGASSRWWRDDGNAWLRAKIALGEDADVIKWVELMREQQFGRWPSDAPEIVADLGRYDLAPYVWPDMIKSVEELIIELEGEDLEIFGRHWAVSVVNTAGVAYAALLSQDRRVEADRIAARLLKAYNTPETRIALAMHAIRAGRAGSAEAEWLREALYNIPRELDDAEIQLFEELLRAEKEVEQEAEQEEKKPIVPPF